MADTAYLDAITDLYREPNIGLCCTTTPVWKLPGRDMPKRMLQMNYGCGSTVNARDLANEPRIFMWV